MNQYDFEPNNQPPDSYIFSARVVGACILLITLLTLGQIFF